MKRAVLFVALLVAGVSSAAAQTTLQVPYTYFTLPNGLNVILHEDHSVPLVTVNVWYHVGSANERPGRTGFAHLFEHLMFMGSGHVKPGEFDAWLEGAGGNNNGSTTNDRTNYWINVPSNALDLALFLESDRMGYLLDSMTPQTVDAQRDVVKNERRQSYENQPYGAAELLLEELLYPKGHPYHWPVIGYMDDLTAASYDDTVEFFKRYYAPSNASLVVAGDIDTATARRLVEKWFSDVKAGPRPEPTTIPGVALTDVSAQDDHRSRAAAADHHRLADAAAVRAGRRRARRARRRARRRPELTALQTPRLRHADRAGRQRVPGVAAAVVVFPGRGRRRGPGHTVEEMQKVIDEEIARLQTEPPSEREVQRAINTDRGVVLQPDGAGRRLRRQGRPVERLLLRDRQPRLVQRGSRRDTACCRPPTFARRPSRFCLPTGASS